MSEQQPEGVHFAANLGGTFYEWTDNVVYPDTQSLFQEDPVKGDYDFLKDLEIYMCIVYSFIQLEL